MTTETKPRIKGPPESCVTNFAPATTGEAAEEVVARCPRLLIGGDALRAGVAGGGMPLAMASGLLEMLADFECARRLGGMFAGVALAETRNGSGEGATSGT